MANIYKERDRERGKRKTYFKKEKKNNCWLTEKELTYMSTCLHSYSRDTGDG